MVVVRLFLVGLMAIVDVEGGVTILTRDARSFEWIDETCIEPHIPLLWWDAKCEGHCPGSTSGPPGAKYDFPRCPNGRTSESVTENGFWILDREELEVLGTLKNSLNVPSPNYLAEMAKIASKEATAILAQKWLDNAPPGLVARLALTGSPAVVAQACHLVTFPKEPGSTEREVAIVEFKRGWTKKRTGPVADVVLVEFEVEAPLRVRATRFFSKEAREVTLRPRTDGAPITLVLSNQTPELPEGIERSDVGLHFEYFYDYSERWPDWKWRRRVPHRQRLDGSIDEFVNNCTEARYRSILEELIAGGPIAHSATDLFRDTSHFRNLGNRPMCPMADF